MPVEKILKKKIENDGKCVLDILRKELLMSNGAVKRAKAIPNGILLNGYEVTVRTAAKKGDILEVKIETEGAASENILPVKGALAIVYEDDDLLVVDKPAGMPVHPSQGHFEDSLANIVAWHYKEIGEKIVFRAVNRLDRGTSGLMIVAKNSHAQNILHRQMAAGKLRREYLAVICGEPSPESGTIDTPIKRAENSVIKRVVAEDGKRAITHYETLCVDKKKELSLLKISLETGRTHQIRVHFSHIGNPLYGDFLYGEETSLLKRPALHSASLEFFTPANGEKICLFSPLPADIKALSAKFLEY